MSKKRGPNSPMESEKTKQSTSAASTLGMAAMLSVVNSVSQAFGGQGAGAVATDSDDEFQSQQEEGDGSGEDDDNPWSQRNLDKSRVRSPRKERLKPIFESKRDGAIRDEIEIEINTKNNKKFTGSITPLEIKHKIYTGALGFPDHGNFDGARVGFKGKLIATIKLIEPIDIDSLSAVEHFEFKRTSTFNGQVKEELIGCKIRGIRWQPNTVSAFENPKEDDGSTVVKIEGCDYMVPEEQIMTWLAHYGEFCSELEEDLFKDDQETGGNNRTGNYSVVMRLEHKIPQLIPMNGRRVKIYHKGIDKLCTRCFGKHRKSECKEPTKIDWINYVREFMTVHEYIPKELYGRWNDLVVTSDKRGRNEKWAHQKSNPSDDHQTESNNQERGGSPQNHDSIQTNPTTNTQEEPESSTLTVKDSSESANKRESNPGPEPTKEQFDIPTTKEAYERMVDRFATIGLEKWEVDKVIEAKTTAYNKACREHKKSVTESKRKTDPSKSGKYSRKNSLK